MIPLLTTNSTVTCPHGGQALLLTSNTEVQVDGGYALLTTDIHTVSGCAFAPVAPSPCLTIQWLTGTTQMSLHGVPYLLQSSVGLCLNAAGAPQGPAVVVQTQQTAKGI